MQRRARTIRPGRCWLVGAWLLSALVGCTRADATPPAPVVSPGPPAPALAVSQPLGASGAAGVEPGARQRASVFFSGHSLLDNPLPDWIELIAESKGDSLGWQEQIVLGSPIRVRTKGDDPEAAGHPGYQLGKSKSAGEIDVLRELKSPSALRPGEKYERLVITERNDLIGTIRWENTLGHLRHFHDRLVEQNAGASTLLYQCWPDIDKQDAAAWLRYVEQELLAWECVAAQLNQALGAEQRTDRVAVIPGGLALGKLVQRALAGQVPGISGSPNQRLDAIFTDHVHLEPPGIYLLAAVHYATLFGKSPVGAAAPAEVSAAARPVLQQLAWDTVQGYRSRAAQAPTLAECRARIASEVCPAYYRLRGKPEKVAQCEEWAAPDGPLSGAGR